MGEDAIGPLLHKHYSSSSAPLDHMESADHGSINSWSEGQLFCYRKAESRFARTQRHQRMTYNSGNDAKLAGAQRHRRMTHNAGKSKESNNQLRTTPQNLKDSTPRSNLQ